MVKYLTLAIAMVGMLVYVDMAEAGRRGCKSCGTAPSGCPGGNCYVPVGGKEEYLPAAPIQKAATSAPVATVAVAPAPAAQTQYVSTPRRGLFGRRR